MGVTVTPAKFGVNVKDFGARGNGSTDDTAAFQEAINAARGGKLFIPQPTANYPITDTLTIQPAGADDQVFIDIEMLGKNGAIRFSGVNKPAFRTLGWKSSRAAGVKVNTENTAKNAVVWDIDGDGTYQSSGNLTFDNCLNSFGTGGQNIGFRYGAAGGNRDFSVIKLERCQNTGQGASYGDLAVHNISSEGLGWHLDTCGVSGVHTGYLDSPIMALLDGALNDSATTLTFRDGVDYPFAPMKNAGTIKIDSEEITYTGKSGLTLTGCTRGANGTTPASHADGAVARVWTGGAANSGGASHTFTNGVSSGTARDFVLSTGGSHAIIGGRYENGAKFITQYAGSASVDIACSAVSIADYTPSDEQVIRLQHPGSFYFHGRATRPSGSAYTAAFLTINHNKWAGVTVAAGLHAADPFHTVSGGATVSLDRSKSVKLDSSTAVTGVFTG